MNYKQTTKEKHRVMAENVLFSLLQHLPSELGVVNMLEV